MGPSVKGICEQLNGNLYHEIPAGLPQEFFTTLLDSGPVRIERIVSHGHTTEPGMWYDQPRAEWVCVLQGEALLRFEDQDELVPMRKGDWINIEAHRRHRVEWTTSDEPLSGWRFTTEVNHEHE